MDIWFFYAGQALIFVIFALSLNLLLGYAGQVSLGHAGFFGLGAYSAALLATRWNASPWIGLLVGMALATTAGLVIGYLSNRLRGPYFVLATIAFSQILLIVASRWRGFTAGSEGIPVPFRPGFWTLGFVDKAVWVYLMLALAVLLYLVQRYLERSRLGYQLAAVREDEDAAQSLGVDSPQWTRRVLVVGRVLALGIAGGFFVIPIYTFLLSRGAL